MILILYAVGLLAIIYFILLKPQRKREHLQMLATLTPNCEIVTIGGMHGIVSAAGEETINIIMKGGNEAKFDKDAIAKIVEIIRPIHR